MRMVFEIFYSHPSYEGEELTESFTESIESCLDHFNAKVLKISNDEMGGRMNFVEAGNLDDN